MEQNPSNPVEPIDFQPGSPKKDTYDGGSMPVGQSHWCHFGVGAPPILVYLSGNWDVHWSTVSLLCFHGGRGNQMERWTEASFWLFRMAILVQASRSKPLLSSES